MNLQLLTTDKNGHSREDTIAFINDTDCVENEVVNLYPDISFQTFEGFGGAVTDSAGFVYSLLNEDQKKEVIRTYFSPEKMGYSIARVHMDSCDFSTEMYEAMSDPEDRELKSFSFKRTEKYILPMLRDAQEAAGKPLRLFLSPWSPPAFMKTNGQRKFGGRLKPAYYGFWADYVCRYIKEFQNHGFTVQRITLQNEAQAVQTWDSCLYSAEEEKVYLRDHLAPALRRHGLEQVEVFIWDHNKERLYERVRDTVDQDTKKLITGAAFHWYSGEHFAALDLVKKLYPDLKLITSESCIEYRTPGTGDELTDCCRLANEIIGDLNHGTNAFYDWNLLLDEQGGPNHAGNWCYAAFLYDRSKKKLEKKLLQSFYYNFSHNLLPGSVRIGTTSYCAEVKAAAVNNPDGSIGIVLFNNSAVPHRVHLRLQGEVATLTLEGFSIAGGRVK